MAGDIRAKLTIDGLREAEKGLKDASKAAGGLAGDLDDTRSKGEKVATALRGAADTIEAGLKSDKAAADALASALGPEFAAKLGSGGVDEAVAHLKTLGLTADDVRADADVLADAIKRIDDVKVTGQGLDALDVSAQKAKGNVDQLEVSLKGVGDTPISAGKGLNDLDSSAHKAKGGVDDLGKSAGSSKSVLANMVGNSVQDVGALGGVAGTAGVAIGQMGEYIVDAMNDGDKLGQTLGNFTKILGPMALLAAATAAVGAAMKNSAADEKHAADVAKFHATQVDVISKALEEGGDAAQAFADHLAEAGKVEASFSGSHLLPVTLDVSDAMLKVGVSAKTLSDAVTGTDADMQRFEAAVRGTGAGVHDQNAVMMAASQAHKDYADGVEKAAKFNKLFGRNVDDTVGKVAAATMATVALAGAEAGLAGAVDEAASKLAIFKVAADAAGAGMETGIAGAAEDAAAKLAIFGVAGEAALAGVTGSMEAAAEAAKAVTAADDLFVDVLNAEVDALHAAADALNDGIDAAENAADTQLTLNDATAKFAEAVAETVKVQKDRKSTSADIKKAVDDERDALIAASKAQQTLSTQQAEALGITQTATTKIDTFNQALEDNANFATPAARKAAYDYIGQLNQIPPEKMTEIQALVAQGKLDEANALLDDASATRAAAIIADANTAQALRDLEALTQDRHVNLIVRTIAAGALAGLAPHGATGGIVTRPTLAVIGEKGPEAVVPLNKTPGSSALPSGLGSGGGGTTTINNTTITNNIRQMPTPREMVQQAAKARRRGYRP